jgi:hypothetical protein
MKLRPRERCFMKKRETFFARLPLSGDSEVNVS